MRKRIYEIIEASDGNDRASSVYDIAMIVIIFISLIPLAFKTEPSAFQVTDKICVAVFILDYLLRLWTADFKYGKRTILSFLRYPFSPMAIVDLISILPSLIPINNGLKVLRIVRMLRAMRVLRVLKAVRYSKSIRVMTKVFRNSKDALAAVGTFAVVYILISALVIINVEPDSFRNFFDAIYWATVSLTTVGYGDIYPVTTIGRIVTMLSSVFGIAIIAMPSGILTAGYLKEIQQEPDNGQTTCSQ